MARLLLTVRWEVKVSVALLARWAWIHETEERRSFGRELEYRWLCSLRSQKERFRAGHHVIRIADSLVGSLDSKGRAVKRMSGAVESLAQVKPLQ